MTQRPPDPRTARTRAAILRATTELLALQPGAAASVAQIARHAGVSVGSVYLHFESKDELVAQVIALAWERHRAALEAVRLEPTPLARVLAFGDALIEFATQEPVAFRALRVRAIDPLSESQLSEATLLASALAELHADLAAAMDAGEIARQPTEPVALLLFAMWGGIAEQAVRRDGLGADPEQIDAARRLARCVLAAGLRTPALAAADA